MQHKNRNVKYFLVATERNSRKICRKREENLQKKNLDGMEKLLKNDRKMGNISLVFVELFDFLLLFLNTWSIICLSLYTRYPFLLRERFGKVKYEERK